MNYCNQCENRCPVTDLKCGRGRRYFSEMQEEKQGRHGHEGEHEHRGRRHEHGRGREMSPDMRRVPDGDDLYALLRACGHHLHHNFQGQRSMEEENALFNVLDESEKEKLQELLKKLVNSWK